MQSRQQVLACSAETIITVFNQTFADTELTLLERGDAEPVYYPAGCLQNPGIYHRILFAHGFVSSALHEIAHWCIAGASRRQLVDYGYWYQPDGRSAAQQRCFEQAETKPQALEWHLSLVCGVKFNLSSDNLDNHREMPEIHANLQFKQAVVKQALSYYQFGLPPRARIFQEAVGRLQFSGTGTGNWAISKDCFNLKYLM